MAGYIPLPPEFTWRDDGNRLVLSLREFPLAQVEPIRSGWVVHTLMHQIDTSELPTRIAVPSLQHGKAWITRWVQCRLPSIKRAIELHLNDDEPPALRRAS